MFFLLKPIITCDLLDDMIGGHENRAAAAALVSVRIRADWRCS
ncbi:MAG: hypothetical protein ACE5E1_07795 [Phycisphaerae bacterium]